MKKQEPFKTWKLFLMIYLVVASLSCSKEEGNDIVDNNNYSVPLIETVTYYCDGTADETYSYEYNNDGYLSKIIEYDGNYDEEYYFLIEYSSSSIVHNYYEFGEYCGAITCSLNDDGLIGSYSYVVGAFTGNTTIAYDEDGYLKTITSKEESDYSVWTYIENYTVENGNYTNSTCKRSRSYKTSSIKNATSKQGKGNDFLPHQRFLKTLKRLSVKSMSGTSSYESCYSYSFYTSKTNTIGFNGSGEFCFGLGESYGFPFFGKQSANPIKKETYTGTDTYDTYTGENEYEYEYDSEGRITQMSCGDETLVYTYVE